VGIASTFLGSADPASVGIVGQVSTVNYAAEVVFAVLMGFLAIRFRHKPLFLIGVLLVVVSAVGNFLAPTLGWMQVFFAMEGIGSVVIYIIGFTLIGDLLSSEKKAKAVGYTFAAVFLGSLVGPIIIRLLADFGSWRNPFLLFAFPLSVTCLVITFFAIPSVSTRQQATANKKRYVGAFKQIFLNRSAALCLLGQVFVAGPTYAPFVLAFFQGSPFLVPGGSVVYIMMVTVSIQLVANIVAGHVANRFGQKRLTIVGVLASGIFLIGVFFMPNFWAALAFLLLHAFASGMSAPALTVLVLDQIPQSRGTMMSLSTVFGRIGWTVAPGMAGLMLVLFSSYQAVGLAAAALGVAAAAVFVFTKENPSGV
jgi:MFS family permease